MIHGIIILTLDAILYLGIGRYQTLADKLAWPNIDEYNAMNFKGT